MNAEDPDRPGAARTRPIVTDGPGDGVPVIREQTPVTEHIVVTEPAPVVREQVVAPIPVVQPPVTVARARTWRRVASTRRRRWRS